jgi:hypothetical protein
MVPKAAMPTFLVLDTTGNSMLPNGLYAIRYVCRRLTTDAAEGVAAPHARPSGDALIRCERSRF